MKSFLERLKFILVFGLILVAVLFFAAGYVVLVWALPFLLVSLVIYLLLQPPPEPDIDPETKP